MAGLPNYFISSLTQTLTVGGNDTSIGLSTIYTQDGQVVTTADFAAYGRGIITVNPLSLASVEFISFTGITAGTAPAGTLTGCLRGLSFKGNNQIAANQKFNVVGTPVIIAFGTHNLLDMPALAANQTFAGINTFTLSPIVPTPTTNTQAANKLYVDTVAISGAPNASNVTKGITLLSVAPASPTSPIAVGDNDTRVPTAGEALALVGNNTDIAIGTGNKYMTQTGEQHNAEKYAADAQANDTYVITLSPVPTSYTAGMVVYFKANTVNTGAATINVNGLGAKTIVKYVSTTLADGDIAAGMFCTLIYDGTNFVLQNPAANQYTGLTYISSASISGATGSTCAVPAGAIFAVINFSSDSNNGSSHTTAGGQVTIFGTGLTSSLPFFALPVSQTFVSTSFAWSGSTITTTVTGSFVTNTTSATAYFYR